MSSPFPSAVVNYNAPVLLVGGGEIEAGAFAAAQKCTRYVVAADGGANRFQPDTGALHAIVGDMDSVKHLAKWRTDPTCQVVSLPEQESFDLEKCLYAVEAPLYIGLGFFGSRLDHSLAATHALLRFAHRKLILVGEKDLMFLAPKTWRATLETGARVSIYPLAPVTGLRSSGLQWPLQNLELRPGRRIGVSNRAASPEVNIDFDTRAAAIILSRCWLGAAIKSLQETET